MALKLSWCFPKYYLPLVSVPQLFLNPKKFCLLRPNCRLLGNWLTKQGSSWQSSCIEYCIVIIQVDDKSVDGFDCLRSVLSRISGTVTKTTYWKCEKFLPFLFIEQSDFLNFDPWDLCEVCLFTHGWHTIKPVNSLFFVWSSTQTIPFSQYVFNKQESSFCRQDFHPNSLDSYLDNYFQLADRIRFHTEAQLVESIRNWNWERHLLPL